MTFLVQRICTRKEPRLASDGVDRFFSFDYMGSSEFEWGALPRALKKMKEHQAATAFEIRCIKLVGASKPHVWFVGAPQDGEQAAAWVADQSRKDRKIVMKEPSYLEDALTGSHMADIQGWWSLEDKWCVFLKKDDARAWMKGLAMKTTQAAVSP